ncbi:LysR substrate-binding domain-containing protein [Lachnotalea glycerini]|uniref:LysR substrate-binding domain-containing protein n=1 Tax=Lachnotalea glycerini TaxID=1763509 RepID=UPI000D7537FD
MFHKINASPQIALEIEEDQVIAGFVAAGFGIAIVPDMPMLNQLPVKTLSIKNPSWERRFYMAYLKGQYQTPVVSDFIQFIKNKV